MFYEHQQKASINLQAPNDNEVHVEPFPVEHEPQVIDLNRTYSSSTLERVSRDLKCDICHTQ
jgi:hypothetical protein